MNINDLRKEIHTILEGVLLAEREGCAKAVEEWGRKNLRMTVARQAAAVIRARPIWLPPITIDLDHDAKIGVLNDQL